jgi:hypothetical protein
MLFFDVSCKPQIWEMDSFIDHYLYKHKHECENTMFICVCKYTFIPPTLGTPV